MSDKKPTVHVGLTTTVLIEYGRTTDVLGTGWKAEMFPLDRLSAEVQEAWWQRTDFGWRCSRCLTAAGVNYMTAATARRSAEKHATEHPGATIQEVK